MQTTGEFRSYDTYLYLPKTIKLLRASANVIIPLPEGRGDWKQISARPPEHIWSLSARLIGCKLLSETRRNRKLSRLFTLPEPTTVQPRRGLKAVCRRWEKHMQRKYDRAGNTVIKLHVITPSPAVVVTKRLTKGGCCVPTAVQPCSGGMCVEVLTAATKMIAHLCRQRCQAFYAVVRAG